MPAILIVIFLGVSVITPAMADGASLARKMTAQVDTDESALIPRPKFTPDKVVQIQLDALANNDRPYQDAGIEIAFRFSDLPSYCGGSGYRVEFNLLLSAGRRPLNHHKTTQAI